MNSESDQRLDVFFYGLFMDEALLQTKGLNPQNPRLAKVANYRLVIGERATLIPSPGGAVYGLIFSLTEEEIDRLYSEASVSIYQPQNVQAKLANDEIVTALCFNLPKPPSASERNSEYATRLKALAERLGLPRDYVDTIS
jgi:hypothetical protein